MPHGTAVCRQGVTRDEHAYVRDRQVDVVPPRESPIQGDMNGDECSGKLYEASGAGRNTAQRLGKYGRRMDPCAKIEAGARIYVSEGMVKDVTVMKYEENG